MQAANIKHFLVVYDLEAKTVDVKDFGDDYEAALSAYTDLEAQERNSTSVDAVLLSADSIETVMRTHSSYFADREPFESLLPEGTLTA